MVAEPDSVYAEIFRAMCAKLVTNISMEPTAQHAKALIIDQT